MGVFDVHFEKLGVWKIFLKIFWKIFGVNFDLGIIINEMKLGFLMSKHQ